MLVFLVLLILLTACVPEPEPYVLEERKPAPDIAQEIAQIEAQAKEQAREKFAEEQQQKQQEESKPAEEPKPQQLVVQQEMTTSSNDIGLYPAYFMDGSAFKPNFITVVGDEAPSSYVVAVANIMARTPGNKPTGFSMLSSEISDLSKYNAIVVGNACNNEVIARLSNNPTPCESIPLPSNKGLLRLYESQNGNMAIIVTGKTDSLVLAAANMLGTEDFKGASGSEVCVQGTSLVQC